MEILNDARTLEGIALDEYDVIKRGKSQWVEVEHRTAKCINAFKSKCEDGDMKIAIGCCKRRHK